MHAYLVDDQDPIRRATRKMLERKDFQVEDFKDPHGFMGALERLAVEEGKTPDVVFVDFDLCADIDGLFVCSWVRSRFPDLPTILYTGDAGSLDSSLAGVDVVLAKPALLQNLLRSVDVAKRRHEEGLSHSPPDRIGC